MATLKTPSRVKVRSRNCYCPRGGTMDFVRVICPLLCVFALAGCFEDEPVFPKLESSGHWSENEEGICKPEPLGGVRWILSVQDSDHGWREETHRAVIALAVSGWWDSASTDDVRQVELQLEVELTKALLRNTSTEMHPNDLALYVHALIAVQKDPRDFHGIDLVDRLSDATKPRQIHPFLLLALCNGGWFERNPAGIGFGRWLEMNGFSKTQSTEYMAMSLNAYECLKADTYKGDESYKARVIEELLSQQREDGSFGNVYTTSLVVQALGSHSWDSSAALNYLISQSAVDPNMVSTYLIQLALNVNRVRFIRDLNPGRKLGILTEKPSGHHYVQYTVRPGQYPEVFYTLTIRVPEKSTYYDIMDLSAKHDSKFNFSAYVDGEGDPAVYSVGDIPNDAEENLYWRLCLQTDIDHNRHTSVMTSLPRSPAKFIPGKDSHMIVWYMQRECEDVK